MQTQNARYSFQHVQTSQGHQFTYTPAKLGVATLLPLLFPFGFLAIFPVVALHPQSFVSGFFLWMVFTLLLSYLIIYLYNMNRRPGTFLINEEQFIINDKTYLRNDISSVYVKTPKGEPQRQTTGFTTVYGFSRGGSAPDRIAAGSTAAFATAVSAAGNAMSLAADASGRAFRNSIAGKSFKICLLYGEKEVVVAKGLTENAANVLFDKIIAVSSVNDSDS